MHPFSTPWKHQKTLRFSDVFRGERKGALETNELRRMLRVRYAVFQAAIWVRRLRMCFSVTANSVNFRSSHSESRRIWIWLKKYNYKQRFVALLKNPVSSKTHLYWSPFLQNCRPASAYLRKLYFRISSGSFSVILREASVASEVMYFMKPSA